MKILMLVIQYDKNLNELFFEKGDQCKFVQLRSHAIAEETTEARVKSRSKGTKE